MKQCRFSIPCTYISNSNPTTFLIKSCYVFKLRRAFIHRSHTFFSQLIRTLMLSSFLPFSLLPAGLPSFLSPSFLPTFLPSCLPCFLPSLLPAFLPAIFLHFFHTLISVRAAYSNKNLRRRACVLNRMFICLALLT